MDQATELNDEQIAELKECFNEFDDDGSGQISTKELGFAMRAMGYNPTEGELVDMINEFDTDGSGQIEFPEFCNMMAVKLNEDSTDEELMRIAFRVLDRKGSGRIEKKEFKDLMTNIGDKLTVDEFNMLISEADKDGDGNLDWEEFVQLMSQ